MKSSIKNPETASVLLRIGLGFVFIYAAVASLRAPLEWAGYLPSFLTKLLSSALTIRLTAILEIIIAVWLFSGRYTRYAAAAAAAMLAGIVFANWSEFIITFRDVGLLFAALALFFLS